MIKSIAVMNVPFSRQAFDTFNSGLRVMAYGMTTVLLVLFAFYIIIKLLVKFFPEEK